MKAVIVIDMLNDFFGNGVLSEQRNSLVQSINRLVSAYREKGHLIVWVRQEFEADLSDAFRVMKEHHTRITIKGTPGCELLSDLTIDEKDQEVIKKRYSPFYETTLDQLLEEHRITELILCGINTHACVRTAAIDAYQRDYPVYLPRDCVGSNDAEHHDISLKYLGKFIAKVVHSDTLIARLDGQQALSFRQASVEDYSSVRDRAYANMINIVLPIWGEWKEEAFKDCYDSRSNFLVHLGGRSIGHIGVKIEGKVLRIKDIQIDGDYQSQGYGRQCMDWIEKYAGKNHCAEIELVVFKSNTVAHSLYLKLGYGVKNEREHSWVMTKAIQ